MTDPTARTEILPAACLVCGEQERACECASFRTELESAARLLRRAGFAAARSGRLHEAHHLMEQAVELDGRCAVSWQALGLCCLALGSITRHVWPGPARPTSTLSATQQSTLRT